MSVLFYSAIATNNNWRYGQRNCKETRGQKKTTSNAKSLFIISMIGVHLWIVCQAHMFKICKKKPKLALKRWKCVGKCR